MTDQKKNAKNWWWPRIENLDDAIEASKSGFIASLIVACVTAAFATYALFSKSSILGIDAWAYFDSVIFLLVAWRIKKYSRVFAVFGTILYVVEKIMFLQSQGAQASSGIFMTIIFLLMFITGTRGVFAYHKFSKISKQLENL